jgi:hypothetical protein
MRGLFLLIAVFILAYGFLLSETKPAECRQMEGWDFCGPDMCVGPCTYWPNGMEVCSCVPC